MSHSGLHYTAAVSVSSYAKASYIHVRLVRRIRVLENAFEWICAAAAVCNRPHTTWTIDFRIQQGRPAKPFTRVATRTRSTWRVLACLQKGDESFAPLFSPQAPPPSTLQWYLRLSWVGTPMHFQEFGLPNSSKTFRLLIFAKPILPKRKMWGCLSKKWRQEIVVSFCKEQGTKFMNAISLSGKARW